MLIIEDLKTTDISQDPTKSFAAGMILGHATFVPTQHGFAFRQDLKTFSYSIEGTLNVIVMPAASMMVCSTVVGKQALLTLTLSQSIHAHSLTLTNPGQ